MKKSRVVLSLILALLLTLAPLGVVGVSAASGSWVTSWTTAAVNGSVSVAGISLNDIIPSGRTVRTELSVTTGGTMLRFCFSNEYGDAPITLTEVTVGRTNGTGQAAVKDGTCVHVTFNENYSVTIPAGERVWSDNIEYQTGTLEKLSMSMYFRDLTYMKTIGLTNGRSFMNNVAIRNGSSQVSAAKLSAPSELKLTSGTVTYHTVPFLCAIESYSKSPDAACAVFIGDSTLVNDAYLYYAQRLSSTSVNNVSVVNQAIVGNRLLSDCTGNIIGKLYGSPVVNRFDRDVLSLTGVKYCFVKAGLNDILHQYSASLGASTPKYSAKDIINGYTKLVNLCHNRGIKIYFFTKSAWNGYSRAFLGQTNDLVWNAEAQKACDELTNWIKTNKIADGYIDCSPLSDPSDPTKLCSTLTLDGAHFSGLGAVALADLIPLSFVGASGGKTAAAMNKVQPYAERNQIIYDMQHPTTTKKPEPTTQKPEEEKTTAPAEEPAGEITTAEETATVPQPSVPAVPAQEYTVVPPVTLPEQITSATPAYITPSTTSVAKLQGRSQQKYEPQHTEPQIEVDKIGSGAGVGFILLLFMTILVIGAVVLFTVTKKKAPDIPD